MSLQRYQPADVGWEFVDTPNPLEEGIVVTSEITGLTSAMLRGCIGQTWVAAELRLRQNPPNEYGAYVITHYRRLLPGTLSFFLCQPKTDAQRRAAFNSTPKKAHWGFDPILIGGVIYQYDPTKFPLSATLADGSIKNVPRLIGKGLFVPDFAGPCLFILNEYLSEVPFPEDMVNSDDPPVAKRVGWDWIQQGGDFGKVLHEKMSISLPDPENYQEVSRFGKVSDAKLNLKEQTFEATNVTTWVEYVVDFEVQRTDGDKGQYYGRELIVVPPPLDERDTSNSPS